MNPEETKLKEYQSGNRRIAKNTLFLYLRMLLSIVVSLYTSRVVLQVLGVSDFGVFSVVGGVVSMFAFLNTAMSGATSRFLTFEMGRGDNEKLARTFSSALFVHIGIAIAILLLAESFGIWWLCNKLVIPDNRLFAAHIVFQCSILSMMITVTQVPYNAAIIAHEKMDVYAYVELLHVFLKLGIVFLLLVGHFDKLIFYAFLHLSVGLIIAMIYRIYSLKNFEESHLRSVWDKSLIKSLLSFTGWNLAAEFGYSMRVYGSNIVLNRFFGTIVNAAGGIATTVQGILTGFVANVVTAVRPQIIKSFSNHEIIRVNSLICSSIRINLFLISLVVVPFVIEANIILKLWLGLVPDYSVNLTRIMLAALFVTSVSQIVTIGIHATGDIRQSSIIRSIGYTATPIIVYIFLRIFNISPYISYVIIVLIQNIVCLFDIYILNKKIPEVKCLSIFIDFVKCVIAATVICLLTYHFVHKDNNIPFSLISIAISMLLVSLVFYGLIFKDRERKIVKKALAKGTHIIAIKLRLSKG